MPGDYYKYPMYPITSLKDVITHPSQGRHNSRTVKKRSHGRTVEIIPSKYLRIDIKSKKKGRELKRRRGEKLKKIMDNLSIQPQAVASKQDDNLPSTHSIHEEQNKDNMRKLITNMKEKRKITNKKQRVGLKEKIVSKKEKELRQVMVKERIKKMRRMGRKRLAKPTVYGPPRKYIRLNDDEDSNKLAKIIEKVRQQRKVKKPSRVRTTKLEKHRRQTKVKQILANLR